MVSAPIRRQQARYAVERGLSSRKACALVGVARSTLSYAPRLPSRDEALREQVRAAAVENPRFGYRRVGEVLGLGKSQVYRLWREERLALPRRRPRRRVASRSARPQAATGANQVWAYDFVFDRCANGQVLKMLTVIDEWTRECLAIEVDARLHSGRVIDVLSRLMSVHGKPVFVRSDNGPELVAKAVKTWLAANGVEAAVT